MLNKIHQRRLLRVAQALREAPAATKKFFTMAKFGWAGGYIAYMSNPDGSAKELLAPKGCGTPACALGHYASREDLQSILKLNDFGHLVATIRNMDVGIQSKEILQHFGLSTKQSEDLFGPIGCGKAHTPIQAAKYIEKFVKENS